MARRRSRRGSSGRSRASERSFELSMYGLIVILLVLVSVFDYVNPAWVSIAGGALLVGAAIYQNQRRWKVSPLTWAGGALLLGAGVLSLESGRGVAMILPIGILIGVMAFSFFTGDL